MSTSNEKKRKLNSRNTGSTSTIVVVDEVDSPDRTDFNPSSPGSIIGSEETDEDEEIGASNRIKQVGNENNSIVFPSNTTITVEAVDDAIQMNGNEVEQSESMEMVVDPTDSNPTNSTVLTKEVISTTMDSDSSTYLSAVSQRQSQFKPTPLLSTAKSYSIDSILTIPQSTQTHVLALPPCSSHLFTGGSDGIIRRYDFFGSLNNSPTDISNPNNLTMKSGTIWPANESKVPVLIGCYENEEPGTWCDEDLIGAEVNFEGVSASNGIKKSIWGPKNYAMKESTVYSLAVQSEELWGLSGTGKGSINLFTIRHDEGQIRHVFKSSDNLVSQGHHSKSPVSAITLAHDEHSFLSGGWDSRILDWDLDTGIAITDYIGHTGQISSISYRPKPITSTFTSSTTTRNDEDIEMNDSNPVPSTSTSASNSANLSINTTTSTAVDSNQIPPPLTSPVSSPDSSSGVAAALVQPSTKLPSPVVTAVAGAGSKVEKVESILGDEEDADGSEVDADGDEDDDDLMNGSTANTLPSKGKPIPPIILSNKKGNTGLPLKKKNLIIDSIPIIDTSAPEASKLPDLSSDDDIFLSTSIDGQVLIWDKRIKNGGDGKIGGVRKFGKSKNDNWCASACWSATGQEIYVGRRNSTVEIYDLRNSTPSNPVLQTIKMPISSGPVTSVVSLPSGKHLISASSDSIRLWDLNLVKQYDDSGKGTTMSKGFKIIAGHQGATASGLQSSVISQLYVDPTSKFLISSSGNRGWEGTSTENVIIYDIKTSY